MKTINRRTVANAIFLTLQAMLGSATASAASITYTFSEAGWVDMTGTTEIFSGSFTGTPEANGNLALTDLSSFSATITETNAQGETKDISVFGGATASGLTDFLYLPEANSLSLAAAGSPVSLICLGSAVATGFCGSLPPRPQPKPGSNPLPPIEGLFSFSVNGALSGYTTDLPSVTQVLVVTPVPVPANAPEPASLVLCGAALLILSKWPRRGRSGTSCPDSSEARISPRM